MRDGISEIKYNNIDNIRNWDPFDQSIIQTLKWVLW